MKRTVAPSLLATLLALSAVASAGDRVALIVSNNVGMPEETRLQHTGTDAERMRKVLVELGQFDAADVVILSNQTAEDVLHALEARAASKASLFLFYYSGHADAESLHLSGTRLPLDQLLATLGAIPAQLRLGILDACQSGAATRSKGFAVGPAFSLRVAEPAQGQVLISSSAADEKSFESDVLRGALFTNHFAAGLRGAADADGSRRVTLSEAYAYAYTQTLRSSLYSASGPQHPTFRWDVSGRQDVALTVLTSRAALNLQSESNGAYILFDGLEREVIAEVPARRNDRWRLALGAGSYVVQKRDTTGLRSARVVLGEGDDRQLFDHQMQVVPLVDLAPKGAFGERRLLAGFGQSSWDLGPRGLPTAHLGLEWDRGASLVGITGFASVGTETHSGLLTEDFAGGATACFLYGLRWQHAAVRLGPCAGGVAIRQAPHAQTVRWGLAGLGGLRARADFPVTGQLNAFVAGDLSALVAQVASAAAPKADLRVVAWWGWSAGVTASW
jgi:Caspase domain